MRDENQPKAAKTTQTAPPREKTRVDNPHATPPRYTDAAEAWRGEVGVLTLRLHRRLLAWRAEHRPDATADELAGHYATPADIAHLVNRLYPATVAPGAETSLVLLDRLIDQAAQNHAAREAATPPGVSRLAWLAARLGLGALARGALALALAATVDRRYERLIGYLNDDLTQRLPTPLLAAQLFAAADDAPSAVMAFAPDAPLRALRLIRLFDDGPLSPAACGYRLDDAVGAFLLEGKVEDPLLIGVVEWPAGGQGSGGAGGQAADERRATSDERRATNHLALEPGLAATLADAAAMAAATPGLIINLHGPDATLRRWAAGELVARVGAGRVWRRTAPGRLEEQFSPPPDPYGGDDGLALRVDGPALAAMAGVDVTAIVDDRLRRVRRQRLLTGAVLVVEQPDGRLPAALHAELLAAATPPATLSPAAVVARQESHGLSSVVSCALLLTDDPWHDPTHAAVPVLRLAVAAPDADARRRRWATELGPLAAAADLAELADRFRLDTGQIAAAAATVRAAAAVAGPPAQADLFAVCRQQLSRELRGFAQVVETPLGWDDLILPAPVKGQIVALEAWVRHRHTVLRDWGFGRKTAAHGGLSALFSGPSGAGKSLSAAILGQSLGLDVYRVDLSAVVSKYIGETEKNLERIFTLATAANAILFFDEADALFGKRSEVQDAHDRYANIEVSYLLQRMETYPGLAILTTNFRQNIDAAFLRRFQVVIEFPFPAAEERAALWRALLPPEAPLAAGVDLPFLAGQFALTGGNIRNCALAAAFAAAAAGQPIGMSHLARAVAAEMEKLEQPVLRSEFGVYYDVVRAPLPRPVGEGWGEGQAAGPSLTPPEGRGNGVGEPQ